MPNIEVEPAATPERLSELGVAHWPVWSKEVSTFVRFYDSTKPAFLTTLLLRSPICWLCRARSLQPA